MREQIQDDRTRARHLLHISQEIIRLKLRFDDETSRIRTSLNDLYLLPINSLDEIKRQIWNEINFDRDNRQKLAAFRTDIDTANEHLQQYSRTHPDGPSALNLEEHLQTIQIHLHNLLEKMDSYQMQLRTLLSLIDGLLPLETHIEEKLDSNDDQIELSQLQTLIDTYQRMIPITNTNQFSSTLREHCEYKLNFYRKILHDLFNKHDRHVSFDGSVNINNNNSTTINSSTSSTSSTPQEHYVTHRYEGNASNHDIQSFLERDEKKNIQQNYLSSPTSNPKNTTTSYISDDCKVLYIETVIEVSKPVIYERTTDTVSTSNTEYHHHQSFPSSNITSTDRPLDTNQTSYLSTMASMDQIEASSEDESRDTIDPGSDLNVDVRRHPRNGNHSTNPNDSGLELDVTSSSSTLNKSRITANDTNQRLFQADPSNGNSYRARQPSTLLRRLENIKMQQDVYPPPPPTRRVERSRLAESYRKRLVSRTSCLDDIRRHWLRSLLISFWIFFLLFLTYLWHLDTCSRSQLLRSIRRQIIRIDHQGIPPI